MPKVIKRFQDKYTKKLHEANTSYEHKDEARIDELVKAGFLDSAKQVEPIHVGGGYYELPNGEKVKGKKQAAAAMKE